MQDYELDAWLGDTPATYEQRARLLAAAETIAARYADDEDAERDAFNAAAAVILGDADPAALVEPYQRAQAAAQAAHATMTGAVVAASQEASERALAGSLGLTRPTIRKALGKC